MGTASCELCGHGTPLPRFCEAVRANVKDIYGQDPGAPADSSPVLCESCGEAAVKPDTVLYGRTLPERLFTCSESDMAEVDVLIVAGTSLTVSPANSLVSMVPETCVRVVVNVDAVGAELGIDYGPASERDIFLAGPCDDVLLQLGKALGWKADLRAFRGPDGGRERRRAYGPQQLTARPKRGGCGGGQEGRKGTALRAVERAPLTKKVACHPVLVKPEKR
eukprot:CAMPEP_0117686520 /NCGR_PEP_ID=MMETSP0804-20121206/22508_1 /TAXON_ID=1074897 /ORGANISM="Tetraselmis astigmatica, Strain CCMP880" /LENGTH=220 /DNA_ID=CAMNT_0005498247 /DNA_START=130 /DNA_END=788 /DNA_ORIENTATION=-